MGVPLCQLSSLHSKRIRTGASSPLRAGLLNRAISSEEVRGPRSWLSLGRHLRHQRFEGRKTHGLRQIGPTPTFLDAGQEPTLEHGRSEVVS